MFVRRSFSVLSTLVAAAVSLVGFPAHAASHEADVVVFGSTPGGFCAAIAAAREGASVVLRSAVLPVT